MKRFLPDEVLSARSRPRIQEAENEARLLDDSVSTAATTLRFLRSQARARARVPGHRNVLDSTLRRSKAEAPENSHDYHQSSLLVSRLNLSGGIVNSCVLTKESRPGISTEITAAVRERDLLNEETIGLQRQVDLARERRRKAEEACRRSVVVNRAAWAKLALKERQDETRLRCLIEELESFMMTR